MDGKAKKRLEVIRTKVQNLKLQLAAAKKQPDDPADIPRIEGEIKKLEAAMRAAADAK